MCCASARAVLSASASAFAMPSSASATAAAKSLNPTGQQCGPVAGMAFEPCRFRRRQGHCSLQPQRAFLERTGDIPKRAERSREAQTEISGLWLANVIEGGNQIVALGGETVDPREVLMFRWSGGSIRRKCQEQPRVGQARIVELAGIRELFEPIFPNRFQHAESWRPAGGMGWDHKRAVHQGGNEVEHLMCRQTGIRPGRLCRFQRKATDEWGKPAQQGLLIWPEQAVAPGDRVAHRALPSWLIAAPTTEERQVPLLLASDRRDRQHIHPGRGQFDRQRNSVKLPANLRKILPICC